MRLRLITDSARAEDRSAPTGTAAASASAGHANGSATADADQYPDLQTADWPAADGAGPVGQEEDEVNLAAVAAYRASLAGGRPLSERKLAAMYGKTSRRWARNRTAEARRVPVPATAEP